MPTYVSPFTGDVVQPTDVSYQSLTFSTNQQLSWPDSTIPGGTTVVAARIIDCIANNAGLSIRLPPANQISVGTDILFRNRGAQDFVVEDYTGGNDVTITAGTARYFYLVDNSTAAGVYRNFTYGAGTSVADAASLVGSGLTTMAGKLETSTDVIEIAVAPTLDENSRALAYVWTSGAGTFNLPNPATIEPGWFIMVRNGGTGALTIVPFAGSLIDNGSTSTFYPSDSAIIVYDADTDNFFTVGLSRQSSVTYTSATYDVDAIVGNSLSLVTFAPTIQTYVAFTGTRTQTLTVTLPAITQLYVFSNATGQPGYNIQFQITGSAQPPLVFGNGVTAIVLSNGTNLTIVATTALTGTFLANNGTAAVPTFSFISDTNTGLYLSAANVLNVTANGQNIFEFNATNLGNRQVSTPAQFNAALIAGGTF
jgi:hypothetical protein